MDPNFKYNESLGDLTQKMHMSHNSAYSGDTKFETVEKKTLLIIYTGGTLGMELLPNGTLSIRSTNSLENKLKNLYEFYDRKYTFLHGNGYNVTKSLGRCRIFYKIHQYKTLIDSSDSNLEFIVDLASQIKKEYDDHDAFLIIHGTDTMEYTASGLSFMIRNLTKPIFFTGSQVPLALVINDAYRNLIGMFRILGELIS